MLASEVQFPFSHSPPGPKQALLLHWRRGVSGSPETCTDSLKLCKACCDPVTRCRHEKPFPRDTADVPVLLPTSVGSQQYGAQHHAWVHTKGKTPASQSRHCHMLVPIPCCNFFMTLSHSLLPCPSARLTDITASRHHRSQTVSHVPGQRTAPCLFLAAAPTGKSSSSPMLILKAS